MSNRVIVLERLTAETADLTRQELCQSPEVQHIAGQIDVKNKLELTELGKEPAMKLSRFSDQILKTIAHSKVNESNELLKQLEALMEKFDKKEVIEQQGFFGKLFKRTPRVKEDLYAKYNSLGRDIEKIHYQFVLMEEALATDNRMLARLYNENLTYYVALEKYIVAIEMKLDEMKTTIIPMYEKQSAAGNQIAKMELTTLQAITETLAQKIDELEKSRMVAILGATQMDMLMNGNSELMEQINGAFIKTIPVFKMGIMNAVNDKRQQLQQQSAAAFEQRMKQFGGEHSDAVSQSVKSAQQHEPTLSLEDMWDTIVTGITDYRQIRAEQATKRQQMEQQLKALNSGA
ncbi:toxic anion resistance protein [Lysinibacillus sp. 38-6]|uniref:toxic anion resistance protein n=1 Tax=Lysinibacillus sp. 38-6 TaxID=3385991 RepID=UPI003908B726